MPCSGHLALITLSSPMPPTAPPLPNPHAEGPASGHLHSSVWGSQGLGEKIIQQLDSNSYRFMVSSLNWALDVAQQVFHNGPSFPGPCSKLLPCSSYPAFPGRLLSS